MFELFLNKYGVLFADCMLIAVETIGLVKFFDNFVFPERNLRLREKCGLEFFICIACAYINSPLMLETFKALLNLFLLSLSITQLAYDCIVHGIPQFITNLFHIKNGEEE